MKEKKIRNRVQRRFGIGEWFGDLFHKLTPGQRQTLALEQLVERKSRPKHPCPFKGGNCSKEGGVCSIRLYQKEGEELVTVAKGESGSLRAVCPNRFFEDGKMVGWVGQTLLGNETPLKVPEVGFLKPLPTIGAIDPEVAQGKRKVAKEVGKIDLILVNPDLSGKLEWCALEIQAVYFSGSSMKTEFYHLGTNNELLPFPYGNRHPDYRSSGPKRLMPQLQLKVKDISRWGKRMGVVVDRGFFNALSQMRFEEDMSNADIAWIVVKFEEDSSSRATMVLDNAYYTKLDDAVAGLTGGKALTQSEFEASIRRKLAVSQKQAKK